MEAMNAEGASKTAGAKSGRLGRFLLTPYKFGDHWAQTQQPHKSMNRISVSSSNLRAVGYDSESSTLEVEFRDSGIYQYFQMPAWQHEELLTAYSKGRYFHRFIKDGYSYRQIR